MEMIPSDDFGLDGLGKGEGDCAFKIVVSDSDAGTIIGRHGQNIMNLEDETGEGASAQVYACIACARECRFYVIVSLYVCAHVCARRCAHQHRHSRVFSKCRQSRRFHHRCVCVSVCLCVRESVCACELLSPCVLVCLCA